MASFKTAWESLLLLADSRLLAKEGIKIAAASNDTLNQHVVTVDAVQHQVIAHRKYPQAGAQIVPPTAGVRMPGKQKESGC